MDHPARTLSADDGVRILAPEILLGAGWRSRPSGGDSCSVDAVSRRHLRTRIPSAGPNAPGLLLLCGADVPLTTRRGSSWPTTPRTVLRLAFTRRCTWRNL